jgi:hypothetical protein
MLVDEDLTADINIHLQQLGNKITAENLFNSLDSQRLRQNMELQRRYVPEQHITIYML